MKSTGPFASDKDPQDRPPRSWIGSVTRTIIFSAASRFEIVGLNPFGRGLFRCFYHLIENFFEIFQTGRRDNDGIPPPADVFGDAQEPSARVLFEGKNKG